MTTVEFQTYIDQDTIELPEAYQGRSKGPARVIIITADVEEDEGMIDFLLDHLYQVDRLTTLTRNELYERCSTK